MYRAGLAWLLAVTVLFGALNCSSSEPGPDPAQETAKVGTSVRPLEAKSCSSCLDIHLSDYNLFLLEDYSGGQVVEGKVAAGGNISMSNFALGQKLSADNLHNAVVAGGTLTLTEGACRGDVYYKVDYVSEGVGDGCLTKQGSPINFVAEFDKLRTLSSRLAASPNQRQPSFEGDGMFVHFKGDDTCVNVFNVDASDLNRNKERWSQWNFNVPAGSFVVVNIHGARLDFGYVSTELRNGLTAKRVLYNFVDATLINGRNVNFQGTLLAPRAHATIESGSLFGGLYAVSLKGGLAANYNPLDELTGGTEGAEETCNGVDDNCDGTVDEGFECTGSGPRSCTAWCGAAGTQSCNAATCGYGECVSSSCCRADADCEGGSYCEGTTCAARKENGAACSGANQCASGQCVDGVCCNSACDGACDACNVTGSVGTCAAVATGSAGSPSCSPYVCNGSSTRCPTACTADSQCIAGDYCNAGACVPRLLSNGATCSAANQCDSGNCVDGVCCNSACGGSCDACNVTGSVGTCAAVATGSAGSPSCSPYVCDGSSTSCATACTADSQCASGNFCSAGACVPTKANGAVCSAANQCGSGNCVDGVCCNTSCGGGACDACNLSGRQGTCSPVSYGETCDNDGNVCTNDVCNGAGSCIHQPLPGAWCGSGMTCNSSGDCERSYASCPSTTKSWTQRREAWNSNPYTRGTYTCQGTLPARAHGGTAQTTLTSTQERNNSSSATFECYDGSWTLVSGTCDGKEIAAKEYSGALLECSSFPFNADREKWIGWYIDDLKRCADVGGLNWWITEYTRTDSTRNCQKHPDNTYKHFFNVNGVVTAYSFTLRDDCFRDAFRKSAASVGEYPVSHIYWKAEVNNCGLLTNYPYANIKTAGLMCKFRPDLPY